MTHRVSGVFKVRVGGIGIFHIRYSHLYFYAKYPDGWMDGWMDK